MTLYLADIASWQGNLMLSQLAMAGFNGVNVKVSHGSGQRSVHPRVHQYVQEARAGGWALSSFHWLDNSLDGAEQAAYAYSRMRELGLHEGAAHVVDCEDDADYDTYTRYCDTMVTLLGRPIATYTGDWWWQPRAWQPSPVSPWLHSMPTSGPLPDYPGDSSAFWAGYGGWPELAIMQYRVALVAGIRVSQSAVRSTDIWDAMTGARPMAMNPRNHPRGAPPDFTLPKPNPDPKRVTDALWWLVCMRLELEPSSRNGGILAIKPGYHSYGSRLPNHGEGSEKTDHSIRWAYDREGPWWREYASAHDWTFQNAHSGNYTEISRYTKRLISAMKDPKDLRPDDVYAYTIGQADGDVTVEGYHERTNEPISGDNTHLWHRHDAFRRNIVGNFWAMWKALTIDMGWTYAEWLKSTEPAKPAPEPEEAEMDLSTLMWDKAKPPAWTAPYRRFLAEADPTVRNVSLHALRHAAETGDAVDKLAAVVAAQQTKLDQMAAVVGAQTGKLDAILAVLSEPPAEPPQG